MLKFISTVELPYPHYKLLDIAVEEEHEHREADENRNFRCNQIFYISNLSGPELKIKVADAGYSSLYHYQNLSAHDCVWNTVHSKNRVCQAVLINFRSIKKGVTDRTMAGRTKKSNLKCQALFDNALQVSQCPLRKEWLSPSSAHTD